MNRRNFIKITGMGVGGVALNSSLIGCSDSIPDEDFGWNGPDEHILLKNSTQEELAFALLLA